MQAVRDIMTSQNVQQMNVSEIIKKAQKGIHSGLKLNKEELLQVLEYYKRLQVIYVDQDENVIFI